MKRHQKRLTIPRKWTLPKKEFKWAPKSIPGPHSKEDSVPLGVALRDMLNVADNAREVRKLLGERNILVDGKVRTDFRFPLGFMDVLSIPKINEHYRILLDRRGKIALRPIPKSNSIWKMCKVINKTTVKDGKIQLNLHDGSNILLEKDKFKTKDVLKLEVPSKKVLGHYPFKDGVSVMVIGGKHAGTITSIDEFNITPSSKPNMVKLTDGFSTIMDYIFVVGKKTPEIKIPEVSIV